MLWTLAPAIALAEDPADARNTRLAADAARDGQSARGVLPLLELWSRWDGSRPERIATLLARLARDRRLSPARRVLVETLRAQARQRLGDPEAVSARFEELGYLTRWRVIGPFDNEGKAGFDTTTPPEEARAKPLDLAARYPGRERPVGWRELPSDVVRTGFVPFAALLRPTENVCALAETFVRSVRAQPLSLWLGAGGAAKVYWNGDEVLRDPAYREPNPERSVALVGARAGLNRVLVKVCITDSAWGFQLRVGDALGAPAKGVSQEPTPDGAGDLRPGPAPTRLPRAPTAPLAELERAADDERPSARALAELARYLALTGSDDPAERRAKQLAARAAEIDPSLEHLLLAARLAEERAEVMRFADRALALVPEDPDALVLAAKLRASGPSPEQALPIVDRIAVTSEAWPVGQLLAARVLKELGLPATALARAEAVAARVGETPDVLRALAELRHGASDTDGSLAAQRKLLERRFDDVGARRVLVADALQRGEYTEVQQHIDVVQKLVPGSERSLLYVASLYDAIGRDDMVLTTYRRAMALAPESALLHAAYGRALLQADRPDLAAEALGHALALKPQDAGTRELLEQLAPKPREDESYALDSAHILERTRKPDGYPATVLQELTVNTVFESGLGSSFRQHAVQIHDTEGARRYRTHSIQFDPDTQRIDIRLARVYRKGGHTLESVQTFEQQLGEPWYRIYYDTRALVVVFPDLEPGDVIELQYRVDDVAHRNLFADYYGDLQVWQDVVPIVRAEYALSTPTSRTFHTNEPALAGLEHSERIESGRRIERWVAHDVPPLVVEPGMPGITETSPYLHVSSYKSWQDVGRWYWGLIKDQLYADDALERTVAELVRGTTTTRERVERIHNWVVRHTRYVALEFGIHGFLPYRVPLIVQRGFGDCKDKASLMYTMFRTAGIDARIALVRTRRNGAIAERPASLAVFDHAIAYVPELNLYLDGTAEHSGTSELPTEDQGVLVLLVGPDGAEARTTPVLGADRNRRVRELDVELALDGSALVEGHEEVVGAEAAGYRDHYEAPGTRAERFERSLGSLYPGVELRFQEFESLTDLEAPVRYRYRIHVPQLARRDGAELRLPPTALDDLLRAMARTPTRVHPLDLQSHRSYVERRTVRLPAGTEVTRLPAGGEAASEFGKLELRFRAERGSITAHTEFSLDRDRVAPSEYDAFRRWIERADELLKQRIGVPYEGP